jgi:hypothetical protein
MQQYVVISRAVRRSSAAVNFTEYEIYVGCLKGGDVGLFHD